MVWLQLSMNNRSYIDTTYLILYNLLIMSRGEKIGEFIAPSPGVLGEETRDSRDVLERCVAIALQANGRKRKPVMWDTIDDEGRMVTEYYARPPIDSSTEVSTIAEELGKDWQQIQAEARRDTGSFSKIQTSRYSTEVDC